MKDREGILNIYLTSWDEKEICLVFLNPIQFAYKLGDAIPEFYEIEDNTQFLDEALLLYYSKLPLSHPFKLFQLWDINDFPFINIVAESVSVKKGQEILGFRS